MVKHSKKQQQLNVMHVRGCSLDADRRTRFSKTYSSLLAEGQPRHIRACKGSWRSLYPSKNPSRRWLFAVLAAVGKKKVKHQHGYRRSLDVPPCA